MSIYLDTKDHFNTKENFQLVYLEELDMLKTHPVPSNIDKYYSHQDYISHTDRNTTLIDKIYQFVKNYSLKKKIQLINRLKTENKSILDIGAGTGDFLNIAKKNEWNITGVEPNEQARKNALTKDIQLKSNIEEIPNSKFDIITLWHVLEHLPDLDNKINQIITYLNKEGYLIIAVPNYKSFDAKYYKNFWAAFDTPRHLWHFSKYSIEYLFKNKGMHIIKTKPMLFDSFYVSLLSEKYKSGKTNYIKAFLIGLLSNLNGILTKEYSSHIYILQNKV